MGSSSGGSSSSNTFNGGKKKYVTFRSRQRAQMSFFIVVMFFGVFCLIVFTEIFLIDERGRGAGVLVRHGSLGNSYSHKKDRPDYEDNLQDGDYISLKMNPLAESSALNAILMSNGANRQPVAIPVMDYGSAASSKILPDHLLPPYPSNFTPSDGSWQNVNGTSYKFFVFSAFFDKRRKGQKAIRIISASKTRGRSNVWCRLWYKVTEANSTNSASYISKTVLGKIKVIRENWSLKYSASFILCPLEANQSVPASVSIVARPKDYPANLLEVINMEEQRTDQMNFGICVKPLHYRYNQEMQILEFIELHRILGVNHFTFYNNTIGPQVDCILHDYIDRGIVTMLPWKLKMKSQKEIRTEGLFAALNDCLYRSMYRFSHLVLIDFDEFIIPTHNDTLPQLIEHVIHPKLGHSAGSFSFQNAFFYLYWDDDEAVYDFNDPVAAAMVTLKKTRMKSKLHPHKQRSKYICRPEVVVEAGNHFVWEFLPGHYTLNVNPHAGFLHHYRICEFGGNNCINTASTVDRSAFRYKERLVQAVRDRYNHLKKRCGLSDLPPPPTRVLSSIMQLLKSRSKS